MTMTMAASAPGIPAVIEYNYVGLRSSVDELKASVAFCRAAMTSASRIAFTYQNRFGTN
jgi:hypothetical protein